MSLSTEDMLHGAALLSLMQSMEDLGKEITYKISRGETKSCYQLLIHHSNNINSLNIGLYIKRSRKRLSPWRYTFSHENQHEIERLLDKNDYLFLLLITDQEGVAIIDYNTLKLLLDNHFDSSEWISVSRKLRENYRICGKNGKLDRALPKNDFPKRIIEYINTNLYQTKEIEPKRNRFNHYIRKIKNKFNSELK
tara:strand:- start:73 stop:657 length:585 start_codon:yes stop_codon:yes gene_type:complete